VTNKRKKKKKKRKRKKKKKNEKKKKCFLEVFLGTRNKFFSTSYFCSKFVPGNKK